MDNKTLIEMAGHPARSIIVGMEFGRGRTDRRPGEPDDVPNLVGLSLIGLDGRWKFMAMVDADGHMPVDIMSPPQQDRHTRVVGTQYVRSDQAAAEMLEWLLQVPGVAEGEPLVLAVPESGWMLALDAMIREMKKALPALNAAVLVYPLDKRARTLLVNMTNKDEDGLLDLKRHAFLLAMARVMGGISKGEYDILPLRLTGHLDSLIGRRAASSLRLEIARLVGRPVDLPMYMDIGLARRKSAGVDAPVQEVARQEGAQAGA